MEMKTKYNIGDSVCCLWDSDKKLAALKFGQITSITAWTNEKTNEIHVNYKIDTNYCDTIVCNEEKVFKNKEYFIKNLIDNFNNYFEEV